MGRVAEQVGLVQVKTIVAVNIALCAGWLVHRVKAIMPTGGEGRKLEFGLLHNKYLFVGFGDLVALDADPRH